MSLKTTRRNLGEVKHAIAIHHTAVDKDSSWDASEALKNLGDNPTHAQLMELHAWRDPDKPDNEKGSYKLPHHDVSSAGKVGAANMKAVASAMGRLNGGGLDIPEADRKGVYAHLKAHYDDAGMDAPDLKSLVALAGMGRDGATAYAETKSAGSIQIKALSDDGTFEGILSPYSNVDEGGDVVEPGAYTKTLKERGSKVPLLWQHKSDQPIGELSLEDRKDGLYCKGKLLLDVQKAREAYLLIKAGIVKGLSIGYESIKDSIEGSIRHLKEIKLYEGSIVTFPMNESAVITAVKARLESKRLQSKDDFNDELAEIQTLQALYQMFDAIQNSIYSLIWAEMEKDEKVAACETILTQFNEAFSAFFPTYLDVLQEVWGPSETWASDRKVEQKAMQRKIGARHSADTKSVIQAACKSLKDHCDGMMADVHDELKALIDDEAGDKSTSSEKAAQRQSEPARGHSAARLLDDIQALIPSA